MKKEIKGYKIIKEFPTTDKRFKLGFIIDGTLKNVNGWGDVVRMAVDFPEFWQPIYREEKYPKITINGYTGEFFEYGVKFGCDKIGKVIFIDLNKMFLKHSRTVAESKEPNTYIKSVTIGKGTFTEEQITEIAEYYEKSK